MAYSILRTAKLKSFSDIAKVENHAARESKIKNADPRRTMLNIELVPCSNFVEAAKKRIGSKTIRKDAVYGIDVFIGASPEYFRDDPKEYGKYDETRLKAFNEHAMKFLTAEFGKDNVISAICHLDEATPHIQAVIIPMDKDTGRLNAKAWLGGKKLLSEMQDRYAEEMKPLGLERGIKFSEATHQEVRSFYGAISKETINEIPVVEIEIPPMMGREKWATEESERINKIQAEKKVILEKQAKLTAQWVKKAKEYQRTASKQAEELKLLKTQTAQLRDVNLLDVITQYDHKVITKNKIFEINGEQISIDGQKFFNHYQNVSGGGAIDLVKHLENTDFKGAVAWLSHVFGEGVAVGAAVMKSHTEAKDYAKEPAPLPHPVEANWSEVRDYLVNKRMLSGAMIDFYHKDGVIFADYAKNVVVSHNGRAGAEKTGTREGVKWKGFSGIKEKGFRIPAKNHNGVIFVESAIDAFSLHMLKNKNQGFLPYKDCEIISVAGVSAEIVIKLAKEYRQDKKKVLIGFDSDDSGEKAYERIRKVMVDVDRLKPEAVNGKECNDWNDVLIAMQFQPKEDQRNQESQVQRLNM